MIRRGVPAQMDRYRRNTIYLKDCPLTHPPLEVVKEGNKAIINYFKELKGDEETVYEAKLIIIGEAGVGKTTLARKLCDLDAHMPDEEKDTTKGIHIRPHDLCEAGKPDFTMYIWDFGGQEIYHSTHQFFLSNRSLYVLLLDGRIEEDPHYWLQVQDLLGEDSPLLIVLNQKGEIRQQVAFQELSGYYPNIRKPLATINLKSDREKTERFRETVSYHIRHLPHFQQGEKIPKKWMDIRKRLEELAKQENYIYLRQFRQICKKEGIEERERQDFLSKFLHSLGVILHFQKEPGLGKMLILNPTWATNAVYKVLDHTRAHALRPGHFSKEDLNTIWHEEMYADVFEELLVLMEKFELCYELPRRGNYIVPQLLPQDQPDYTWNEPAKLQVRYKYTFLPKGIVTRLIVRLHNYVEEQDTVWKRGAVFSYQGSQAEVIERFREKEIHIKAKGPDPKALVTIILKEIDELNATFDFDERLSVDKLIPCMCDTCQKLIREGKNPHFYAHESLLQRKIRGKATVECDKSYEDVSVMGLLDAIFSKQIYI